MKLIKSIKDAHNSSFSHGNVGAMRITKKVPHNQSSQTVDHSSAIEQLLPKATKIPKNDEDLKNIHEVLIYSSDGLDEN
jgi:hypothetical protein